MSGSAFPDSFVIAVQLDGRWVRCASVTGSSRLQLKEVDGHRGMFPVNTKAREQVFKACKWLRGDDAVNWVEFQVRSINLRAVAA